MTYQRYRFDRSFGGARVEAAPPPPPPEPVDPMTVPRHSERALQAAVAAARQEAQADGLARGRREGEALARKRLEADIADGLTALLERADALEAHHAALLERLEQHGAVLLAALVGRLAPQLMTATARAEVERVAGEVLRAAAGAPELRLRVHPSVAEDLETRLRGMAADTGYAGSLAVVADDTLVPGALDASWEAGGLRRDPADLERMLEAVVERTVAALAPAVPTRD